ncbi:hypothetical protein J6590_095684 [Homalodisca vitripennis]|nr:hypothetical protein J6590_095684 [Homalodisca vitripennis]
MFTFRFHEIERKSYFAEAPRLEQAVEAARAISYSHPFPTPPQPLGHYTLHSLGYNGPHSSQYRPTWLWWLDISLTRPRIMAHF